MGSSDGWQNLMDEFRKDWEFGSASNGNIALMGELNLRGAMEFTLGAQTRFCHVPSWTPVESRAFLVLVISLLRTASRLEESSTKHTQKSSKHTVKGQKRY